MISNDACSDDLIICICGTESQKNGHAGALTPASTRMIPDNCMLTIAADIAEHIGAGLGNRAICHKSALACKEP